MFALKEQFSSAAEWQQNKVGEGAIASFNELPYGFWYVAREEGAARG